MAPNNPSLRQAQIHGPDTWREIDEACFCHWDRWYPAVLEADCGGSWRSLQVRLV